MTQGHANVKSNSLNITGICAAYSNKAETSPTNTHLKKMLIALPSEAHLTQIKDKQACTENGGWTHANENISAVIVGRPHWQNTSTQNTSQETNHATSLVECYKKYGEHCAEHVNESFAFVLIDHIQKIVIAAVDRFSRYPLLYSHNSHGISLASTTDALCAAPGITKNLYLQAIYNYIYFHMVPSPTSIYEGLKKIPAAHQLIFKNNHIALSRYWVPQFTETQNKGDNELHKELLSTLKTSVSNLASKGNVGSFLSGGLDSSTISGLLSNTQENCAKTFTIGFDAKGYDETEYARLASKHFHTQQHEYYVTPDDVVNAAPLIAASYDEPFGNSSALPTFFCAQLAKDNGIKKLLAGDGGDELFAGNKRYLTQANFERYRKSPTIFRKGVLEPLLNKIPSNYSIIGKTKSFVKQANIPLPDRLQTYNFLHRQSINDIFTDDFLNEVSAQEPLDLQRSIYHAPNNANIIHKMLYLDWHFTLADNDLKKVSRMCALSGIDVVYPMLEDEVVDFACRVPTSILLKDNKLRAFYKESVNGFLPNAIINKTKKGFGLPFGVWMKSHTPLQELGYDNILKLKSRGFFKPSFIDKTIDMHRTEHAAYYGELVWVLMMLELWLDSH